MWIAPLKVKWSQLISRRLTSLHFLFLSHTNFHLSLFVFPFLHFSASSSCFRFRISSAESAFLHGNSVLAEIAIHLDITIRHNQTIVDIWKYHLNQPRFLINANIIRITVRRLLLLFPSTATLQSLTSITENTRQTSSCKSSAMSSAPNSIRLTLCEGKIRSIWPATWSLKAFASTCLRWSPSSSASTTNFIWCPTESSVPRASRMAHGMAWYESLWTR